MGQDKLGNFPFIFQSNDNPGFFEVLLSTLPTANDLIKKSQFTYDPVLPESVVSKFSKCQAINKTWFIKKKKKSECGERVWLSKKTHMLILKIDSSSTDLETLETCNQRRNLQYFRWEMARAEIQSRREPAFEDFVEKNNGKILEEMGLSKRCFLYGLLKW